MSGWNNQYLGYISDSDSNALLYYCIMWSMDTVHMQDFMRSLLNPSIYISSAGGDPGWDIAFVCNKEESAFEEEYESFIKTIADPEEGYYECSADGYVSGIYPKVAYYTKDQVFRTLKKALIKRFELYPERKEGVDIYLDTVLKDY